MAKKTKRKTLRWPFRACWKQHQLHMLETLSKHGKEFDRDGRVIGYAGAHHRINPAHSPYCVPCEYICAKIGAFLGIPIPPFAITDGGDRGKCFSSLDFNFNREKLPHVLPDKCMEFMPEACAGVLVFDILIANEDRHDKNLLVDMISHPREMHAFDHDQALLGGFEEKGKPRLLKLADHLGITGDDIGGNRHIFLDELTDPKLLDDWMIRVESIPDWFIDDICKFAVDDLGITKVEGNAASDFLKYRKDKLVDIIRNNKTEFKAVKEWPPDQELFK